MAVLIALLFATSSCANAQTYDPRDPRSPLRLIRTIELPDVKGRIDHMALETGSGHLFIAENGNGSVDDVDLASGKVAGRIKGLHEPQAIAWLALQHEIAVTTGDGLVTFYNGSDRQQVARINLGSDADNVRIDPRNGQLVVGYGSGGLAIIDPATHHVIRRLPLAANPEAFELVGSTVIVNVPDAHKIIVADLDEGRVISTIGTGLLFGNFPMAFDPATSRIAVAYRAPGAVSVFDARSRRTIFSASICGDADDLYFRSGQLIIVCGSGAVELMNEEGRHPGVLVASRVGARTGLLDLPDSQMFVGIPARQSAAAVWIFAFQTQ